MTKEEVKETVKEQKKTESEKMWTSIKDVKIDVFSLPNQVVSNHCEPITFSPPGELWLKAKSQAVIRSLEAAIPQLDFDMSLDGKYIIARKKNGSV